MSKFGGARSQDIPLVLKEATRIGGFHVTCTGLLQDVEDLSKEENKAALFVSLNELDSTLESLVSSFPSHFLPTVAVKTHPVRGTFKLLLLPLNMTYLILFNRNTDSNCGMVAQDK